MYMYMYIYICIYIHIVDPKILCSWETILMNHPKICWKRKVHFCAMLVDSLVLPCASHWSRSANASK